MLELKENKTSPYKDQLNIKTNSREHATIVVNNLYKNGSDSRQVKNGNPDKLIDHLMKSKHISTCGIFTLLDPNDMKLIHDKSKIKMLDYPEIKKRVAKIILQHANKPELITKQTKIYCRVSEYGLKILDDIINSTSIYKIKDLKRNFNIRVIFEHQERQKILGSFKKE